MSLIKEIFTELKLTGVDLRKILRDEITTKNKWERIITSPSSNTSYYLPEIGGIDFKTWCIVTFLIKADQPCTAALEFSKDGVNFSELAGYRIEPADWDTTRYNNILTDLGFYYGRLKVTTGSVAPSSIEMIAIGRP